MIQDQTRAKEVKGSRVHGSAVSLREEEPLFQAIRAGHLGRLKALMASAGTNLMLPSKPGWLAIHQAACCDQEECLRLLLSGKPLTVTEDCWLDVTWHNQPGTR